MKNFKYFSYFAVFLLIILLPNNIAYSQESDNSITFIYIPGILSTDINEYKDNVKDLHKQFANKKIGEYQVSPIFKVVDWADLPRNDLTYELFQNGLIKMNSANNESGCKKTSKANPALLLNPVNRFLLLEDSGSSAHAVFWRNYLHNHIYDVIWFFVNEDNRKEVFNLIQNKVNECDGRFVLIANSFGAIIAVNYVLDYLLYYKSCQFEKNKIQDDFLGLITTADANNTVYAPILSKQVTKEQYEAKKNNFIKFIVDNDKFWISLNHRSDIIATGIADEITSFNDEGKGFIAFKTNSARPLKNFILAFKFWDRSNGLLQSHNWCFHKPEEFSRLFFTTYDYYSNIKP